MKVPMYRRLAAAAAVLAVPALLSVPGASPASAAPGDYLPQATVAFSGITIPQGVALNGAAVVATSYPNDATTVAKVVSKGTGAQTVLATGDLASPFGVAVDAGGNTYVSDASDNRVLKVPAGGGAATTLAFTGLQFPTGVAVNAAGDVFVADSGNARVVTLPAGGGTQSTVAFTGLQSPYGVAVRGSDIYVADLAANAVLKLSGGTQSTVAFTGLSSPDGLAVDGAGNVYVSDADNNRVLKEPAAGGTQVVLPFIGLSSPAGVAVTADGAVYVADTGNNRVLTLGIEQAPANTAAQSFVIAAYNDYIQRNPTAAELSAGVAAVGDPAVTSRRAAFVRSLANSDKYVGAFVNKLYFDTLGRAGDPGGVAFWTRKLQTKTLTPAQVSGAFYGSNEYFRGFGKSDNATWVRDLYQKILLRPATTNEVNYTVALLGSRTRTSVATSLFQGNESARVRTRVLYQRFLQRDPDAEGLTFWSNRIPTQGDLALAVNLSSSSEYLRKSAIRYP